MYHGVEDPKPLNNVLDPELNIFRILYKSPTTVFSPVFILYYFGVQFILFFVQKHTRTYYTILKITIDHFLYPPPTLWLSLSIFLYLLLSLYLSLPSLSLIRVKVQRNWLVYVIYVVYGSTFIYNLWSYLKIDCLRCSMIGSHQTVIIDYNYAFNIPE